MDFNDNVFLINSLKSGNEKAFMFLFNKYHRRLNAYALSFIDDKAAAQDIMQEVFLKTWKYRKRLDSQFSIQSFLYKSIYNEFINQYAERDHRPLIVRTAVRYLLRAGADRRYRNTDRQY